ncbi:PaaI family thioesterase [Thalassospira sp.]|uniref:PaaI family thioesterase n=1 Tax=Thalassospira sp. TaxID=1912094 RepID=UPI000C59AD52|nr:PaaI family thioesterase [Thalassospira sp.]MBC08366.1 aromatic compounds catabolism protein [Thalassospira sp.]|tara:strand:+ start:1125 stop:1574 length:450 start_codon:yes stop_codon:yes gene_type:complete
MTGSNDNLAYEQAHGSGLQDHLGYRLVEWAEDHAVVELDVQNHHCNRAGILHGGVLTTLMDTASGYAVCFCPVQGNVRRSLTLSLTTNFLGMAKEGLVRVVARKQGGGRKVVFTEAVAYDQAGNVIGTSTGTFKYHRGSDDPDGVPRDA